MMNYSHLLYVEEDSPFNGECELVVYGVNTNDIFHTIGEFVYRHLHVVKQIRYAECTPKILEYWKMQGKRIFPFSDKYNNKNGKLGRV